MTAFLHGVETVLVDDGATPITVVRTSVVNYHGTAPKGPTNQIVAINNERQAIEVFGNQVPGFTLPSALKTHFDQGGNRVLVTNVFDAGDNTMITAVASEAITPVDGKAKLAFAPVGAAPAVKNAGETITYVEGTDYTIDAYGNLVVLNNTTIPSGTPISVTYTKFNPAGITTAIIIGTITNGVRSGYKVLEQAMAEFGYIPKILCCPTYCETDAVAAEMLVLADKYRAIPLIDAPEGTTVAAAISGRGTTGTVPGFQTSDKRALLCFPYQRGYDPATDSTINKPYSPFVAGAMSAEARYWKSPSNKELKGHLGSSIVITADIRDANTDANALNEVGILTTFAGFGTGTRTWGNRNASWPTNTSMDSFISVQRVRDIVHDSLELAMFNNLDEDINQALIDRIKQSCQNFINVLIGRGALVQGSKCIYNPDDNPADQIALGRLTYELDFAGPTPAERITFKSRLNPALLVFA